MPINANRARQIPAKPRETEAFTLLEVMIAAGIFFMAVFAILALVTTNIRNAQILQKQQPSDIPAMVLADVAQTNKLEEGTYPYDISEMFPGYTCSYEVSDYQGPDGTIASNLFLVECVVSKNGGGENSESHLTTFMYRPQSTHALK